MQFSEQQKKDIWNRAQTIEGYAPDTIRKDACGAWIVWDRYGDRDNLYGWEIDHIVPQKMLQEKGIPDASINSMENLRALQCQNNIGKGDDYPHYTACVTADGNKNVEKIFSLSVNERKREILNKLYGL